MAEKVAELERQTTATNPNGTFGFSVLGGAGTKFPAVVCEVDPGGPADRSGKIRIGDKLRALNGEELMDLTPYELVQSIRSAPNHSTFILEEDDALREQVVALLEKRVRRAQARQQKAATSSASSSQPQKKQVVATGRDDRDRRKGKKDKRIIEVEPSVNISGGEGHIVQVLDNRIIGQVEQPSDESSLQAEDEGSGVEKSPQRSPRPRRSKGSPPKMEITNIPDENGTVGHASLDHRHGPGYTGSLERKPHLLLPTQGPPTKSISMDSFSLHSGGSAALGSAALSSAGGSTGKEVDTKGFNGVNRSYSGSSGLNYMDESGSQSSFEEKERGKEQELPSGAGGEGGGGSEGVKGEEGVHMDMIQIPQYPSNMDPYRARGSLSEELLINELSREPLSDLRPLREGEEMGQGAKLHNVPPSPSDKPPESPKWLDPAEKERLMQRYQVVRSNSKKRLDPTSKAVTLARKLYMLDGFKKSEVAEKLADPSEFGQAVAKEYLSLFDFHGMTVEMALRQFLAYFSLTGESQERERVMQHFSERYFQCNPESFHSADTVHGLSIAILLLNTDLHTDHGGRKMSQAQFTNNLGHIGVSLPKDMLKTTYTSIKKNPLEWALDDDTVRQEHGVEEGEEEEEEEEEERVYHVTIPGTFVQVELPGSAPVFKEGFIMRKNIMDAPHKKVPRGKRQWKAYYAYLKGFLLYFAPPQGQGELHLDDTSSAITITHCLAMGAHDYHKKSSVLRVTTADWHVFLLQATNVTDMQQWIGAINKAASLYSSPPLAAPVASQAGFHRPTFPLAPTRNSQEQQEESHEAKIKSLEKEMKEHQTRKPTGKNARHGQLEAWFDQYEFIQFEVNRFRIYLASLSSDVAVDYNAPLPSGLIPSPSISTLHNPDQASGEADFLEEFHRHGHTSHIVPSPPTSRLAFNDRELHSHSPLLSRQRYHK